MDECRSGWAARREEGGRRRAESGGIRRNLTAFLLFLASFAYAIKGMEPEWSGMVRNGPEWSGMVRNGVGNVMELDWEKRGAVLMETMEFDR